MQIQVIFIMWSMYRIEVYLIFKISINQSCLTNVGNCDHDCSMTHRQNTFILCDCLKNPLNSMEIFYVKLEQNIKFSQRGIVNEGKLSLQFEIWVKTTSVLIKWREIISIKFLSHLLIMATSFRWRFVQTFILSICIT